MGGLAHNIAIRVLGNLAAMTHGASVVYPSEGFNAEATLRAVSEERCTALHGVPTMFITEMNHPRFGEYNMSSLRLVDECYLI